MQESKATYETACLAKEKGFDEICHYHFGLDGIGFESRNPLGSKNSQWAKCIARPTLAFLQDWLREKHNIHVFCIGNSDRQLPYYGVCVMHNKTNHYREDNEFFYHESLEIGIQKGLKLLKDIEKQNTGKLSSQAIKTKHTE